LETLIVVVGLETSKYSITREGNLDIGFDTSQNTDAPHAGAPVAHSKYVAPVTGIMTSLMKVS